MAIEHMDNFSIYGSSVAVMLNGVYAEVSGQSALVADPDGISSGSVYRQLSSAAAQATLRYVWSTSKATMGQAIRVWMNQLPTIDQDRPRVISYRNGSNVEFAYVIIETTGRLTFTDGTTTITTTNPVIAANGWYHIEVKYSRSGVGSIEIRVEGITVMLSSNLGYVGAANIFQTALHYFGNNFGSTIVYWKDLVLWDGTGTYNNDFLGSVLVYNLAPISDVSLNWTPSTGAVGWSILDNVPPNDAQFLSAPNPPPLPYVAEINNLPVDVTSVKGIMTMVRAAKTDGGDANLQIGVISDPAGVPATALGANRPITVAQTYWRDVFETDPKTAAPWLPSAVNVARLQMNRTA